MLSKYSLQLTVSSLVASLMLGISIGYYFNPDYQSMTQDQMDLGAADRWVDLRYVDAMIAHHRGAMLLADQAKQSQRPEISELAAKILTDEPKLISELYEFKQSWYGNSRQVSDPQAANLGIVDENFDLRFLNALIFHHQQGIEMTQSIRTKSSRTQVLDNADSVENFLRTTLPVLEAFRKDWYGI